MKIFATVLRLILTLALLFGIYTETGIFTAVAFGLTAIVLEFFIRALFFVGKNALETREILANLISSLIKLTANMNNANNSTTNYSEQNYSPFRA